MIPENVFQSATNLDGTSQFDAVIVILETAFGWVLDFLFTIVSVILSFLTRPDVLGAIVAIVLIFIWYKWFKRKSLS